MRSGHTIYNIKRCRAAVGTGTTDGNLEAVARLTRVGLNVHTRRLALQGTENLCGVHLLDIVALDLHGGTGDEFLFLHTITDDDNVLKSLIVGFQRDGEVGLISDSDLLSLVANVGDDEGSSRLDIQGEVTIEIRYSAILRVALLHDAGTDDRSIGINDVSGDFLCLLHGLCRQAW